MELLLLISKEMSSISAAVALMWPQDWAVLDPAQHLTVLLLPIAAQKQAINGCGVEGEGTASKVNDRKVQVIFFLCAL